MTKELLALIGKTEKEIKGKEYNGCVLCKQKEE